MNKYIFNLINNIVLLISGVIAAVSGLTMQVGFHMHGGHEGGLNTVMGFAFHEWSLIHKVSIVIMTLTIIYHFIIHWKWYKGVLSKHLIRKNRVSVYITIVFVLVAITGLVPWFIDLSGGSHHARMGFIEIHDKFTLLLVVLMAIHIVKKFKWYNKIIRGVLKRKA
jgi:hypothetical protein